MNTDGHGYCTIPQVVASLTAPQHKFVDALLRIPHAPGLYAIYADAQTWAGLGLKERPDNRPLYVGKAESSLHSRDLQCHFSDGRTGQSTLRRSLAALLAESLDLCAVPRNLDRPGYFSNYALRADCETRLSAWMAEKLLIAWWKAVDSSNLAEREAAVMAEWLPPLNLQGCVTPWTDLVKAARAKMADQARRWTQ